MRDLTDPSRTDPWRPQSRRARRPLLAAALALSASAALAVTTGPRGARASDGDAAAAADARARCATRLSIALLGQSPSADDLAAPDPQARVDAKLASWNFV